MSTKAIAIEDGTTSPKALNIGLWVVQVLLAAMFFMAGGNKLGGNPQMVGMFEAIGIGQWFRYLTGSLEVIGALLLLIPTFSGVGGLLLTGVMGGALLTHLFIIGGNPTMAIVLFVGALFVAYGRGDRTLKLIGR
jgi:putative oxidoreductase